MPSALQHEQPHLIYLNNAATTWPKPPAVLEEVANCLRQPLHEPGRTTGNGSMDYPSAARESFAAFFHTGPPEHYIFTQNATDALNLLIHGLVKKIGVPFHTITTELHHNSVLRPLTSLEQEGAISLSVAPFTDNTISLTAIKKAIGPETSLVVMTHGSNVLGSVQDIKPIAEYLNANDIFFIVDGAQTAGHIRLISLLCPSMHSFSPGIRRSLVSLVLGDFLSATRTQSRSPARGVRERIHGCSPTLPICRCGLNRGHRITRA